MKNKIIKVDCLARVEGEGGLSIKVVEGKIVELNFNIFEPPRFFEAFLRGRHFSEVPDITARICGICPVAYQMSSINAIERAFGIEVSEPIKLLRRLIYCGEWLESHALHVFLLHAPDFLGYEDALQMAKDHSSIVQMGLRLKKIGNEIMRIVGGREIHPINIRVGGFYKLPLKSELKELVEPLKWSVDACIRTVRFVSRFSFPEFERHYEFVALQNEGKYAIEEGRIVSNKGIDIDVSEYEDNFYEEQVSHSTALHSVVKGRGGYLTGPVARFNLNFDKLTQTSQEIAKEAGIEKGTNNPFKSIIVRAIEMLYVCEEALRIIENYEEPDKSVVNVQPRVGIGYGCTEAPRGILYHRYRFDNEGLVLDAKIVPPTSQNQKSIEEDLYEFISGRLNLSKEKLTWQCEQAIRNYDPCISCSTHFLRLNIVKEE